MSNWKVSEIYEPQPKMAITEMAMEDRPREKMMQHGAEALSTAELLAILIGSGNTKESAVDLMKRILKDCDNNLSNLCKMSLDELMRYNGIGEAKAITIMAACELGKRREQAKRPERTEIHESTDLYDLLWPRMRDLDVEEAYLVLMNQSFKVIKVTRLSHGGLTETAVDIRMIIKEALMNKATVIALAHNHPSGNIHPSRDDDMLTKRINDACRVMRIYFMDHVIITDGNHYSFRDEGKL